MTKRRSGLTLLLACLVIFALAPAAAAQLPSDPVGDIGDAIGGGGDDPTAGGDDPTGGGDDPVGGIVGGIEDTLDDDGESDGDGNLDDPKLIDDTTKEINDTLKDPGTKLDETTEDPSGTVGGTIRKTTDTTTDDLNDTTKKLTGKGGKERKDKGSKDGVKSGSGSLTAAEARADKVFAESLAARQADAKNRTPSTLTSSTTSVEETVEPSGVIQQIGRVAVEAAQNAAFPLLLTLLVGAFLIGQNRIDSRDPKLAMAPIDSDQDLLSFT